MVSSAGEPLNPEVVRWFDAALGAPIYDHYGQTELGMVVNNHHGLAHVVHAGSAGFAMPGYRVAVLDDASRELGPGEPGNLAIDIARSPLPGSTATGSRTRRRSRAAITGPATTSSWSRTAP